MSSNAKSTSTQADTASRKTTNRSTVRPTSRRISTAKVFQSTVKRSTPNDPDHLSGTKTWGDDGTGQVRSFVYQVTWRFTRCPQKLLITELKFEHPKFPNYEDWKEIDETIGTIDGNRIKVKAKVLNMSAETKYADLKVAETYKGDKYNGARPDEPIPDGESSLRIEPAKNGTRVHLGFRGAGVVRRRPAASAAPHQSRAFGKQPEERRKGKAAEYRSETADTCPRHLYRSPDLGAALSKSSVGESQLSLESVRGRANTQFGVHAHGQMESGRTASSDSVYDNADQLAKYVKHAQDDSNAWHVDMVAHSTGGLVARLYLHKLMPNVPDARPQVKHLIMLGTPNGGVPCIDVFVGKLGMFKHDQRPLQELTNASMLDFNKYVVNTGGAKLSALAGNPVPLVCGGFEWNDGFVTVKVGEIRCPGHRRVERPELSAR